MRIYTIVIVENDDDEQFFLKEGIITSGLFEILGQFYSGEELFEWLEQNPERLPEIILSDLSMPGKNGYDILSEMKSNPLYTSIPIVITSTSSTRSTVDRCLALGAAAFIEKPDTFVNYGPFLKKLYQLIEEKHLVK